jgi:hypothetical protein
MRRRSSPPCLVLAAVLAGCAATRPGPPPQVGCPASAVLGPEAAICARDDGVSSLRARFRAEVRAGDASRTAEGVLVWRKPGELRVKLFTLAGLTVYDALWVGDEQRVRGLVRQPLADRAETFDLGPGDIVEPPEGDLALVLWALWRPRCSAPPARNGDLGRFQLDAAPARALRREVVIASGVVQEEVLVRRRAGGTVEDRVVARYGDYDCAQEPPLPRRISVEAPSRGWRAQVTIVEQVRNEPLDDGLFDLGEPPVDDGPR